VKSFCSITIGGTIVGKHPTYCAGRGPHSDDLVTFRISVTYQRGIRREGMFIDCKYWDKTANALRFSDTHNAGDPVILIGKLMFEEFTSKQGTKIARHYINVDSWYYAKEVDPNTKSTALREVESIAGEDTDELRKRGR
jgi:single-stranded DNA-binding protein